MSVVLIGPAGALGRAVFARLRGQGDDIRVIESDPAAADEWKDAGAFVATADEWDADLIERACYEARTVVVFPRADRDEARLLDEVVAGAVAASIDRIVVLTQRPEIPDRLASSPLDHVVISMGKRSLLRRSVPVEESLVAEAVDAADDLEGHPRLFVDLARGEGAKLLGI
jgi:nucleoside-diphosphate-sugar epimerase